jgi:hypothetical protein
MATTETRQSAHNKMFMKIIQQEKTEEEGRKWNSFGEEKHKNEMGIIKKNYVQDKDVK